jgi:hypothetical protein
MNFMFLFHAAQEYPIFGSKPGLFTPTQKGQDTDSNGQETDYPFRKSSILCCSVIKFLEPRVSQFRAMKETNIKNLCCSRITKYFRAAQKPLFLFRAAHWNKQKYFDAFSLLWDDTKSTNCPGRAGFAKATVKHAAILSAHDMVSRWCLENSLFLCV